MTLSNDRQERKTMPLARGLFDYFPDALAAVANVSYVGNQQHNPGEPMHWARGKSDDHADCLLRHIIDRGKIDDDGVRHSAKVAWRALANLQIELENANGEEEEEVFYVHVPHGETFTAINEVKFTEQVDPPVPPRSSSGRPLTLEESTFMQGMLRKQGCTRDVARIIADGTTFPILEPPSGDEYQFAYIAGPMRGHEHLNFPEFDMVRDEANRQGFHTISPADIDRASGVNENNANTIDQPTSSFVYRDFHAIFFLDPDRQDQLILLPGWEESTGAVAEFFLARWLGLGILNARTFEPLQAYEVDTYRLRDSLLKFLVERA